MNHFDVNTDFASYKCAGKSMSLKHFLIRARSLVVSDLRLETKGS